MTSATPINPSPDGWPLSPEQRWMLAACERTHGGDDSAAALLLIDLRGTLDVTRLRRALCDVTAVHESLCTAFRPVSGYRGLRQRPLQPAPLPEWDSIDLRGQADAAQRLDRRLEAERRTPFRLDEGRVWRAVLFRLEAQQWSLVVSASRLVADRLSLVTLYRALLDRYLGLGAAGPSQPPGLPDAVCQYGQFVAWRQDLAQSDEAESGRAYWDRHIARAGADAPQAPRLAYRARSTGSQTGPVSGAMSGQRSSLVWPLAAATAAGLEHMSQVSGVPVEVWLHTAWWVLLARLSGQPVLLGGWQHDCRRDYDVLAGAVGVFDKILPLALECQRDDTLHAVARRLSTILEAHRNWQEYWPVAEPPHVTHYEVGFVLADIPAPRVGQHGGADLLWEVRELPGPSPVFELAVQVELGEAHTPVRIGLHYDTARYSSAAVQGLLSQYATLLSTFSVQQGAAIADLSLIGACERSRLLAMRGVTLEPGPRALPEHIAAWGTRTPEALALVAGDLTLTYAAMQAHVNHLARWLITQGVRAETPVALLMPRSGALVVALLAVLRAGGAYLPLDPAWPSGRRQEILADARPVLVLSHSGVQGAGEVERAGIRCVRLDTLHDLGSHYEDSPPDVDLALHQAAYILYTSGSTGTPKGVVIEHGQLLHYVSAVSAALDLASHSRFALISTVAADLGHTTLFGAFYNGACLAVADQHDMQDATAFADFIRRYAVDCVKIVPSHLDALLDPATVALPRTLILGGEATPLALVQKIQRLAPECRIYNHYGPTETTVGVMTHACDLHDAQQRRWHGELLPLTQPLANCRLYLLDEALRLVPTGALGELYIGGPQVCRGYLHQAAADSFVADPFQPGERLYRTGDLGHYLPEGGLQLAGRADQQLKIRGFRIEPAEVEAALLAVPGIRQAVVRGWGEGTQARLAAYLVTDHETPPIFIDALKTLLLHRLPVAMVPASFVVVPELPRLENGKIDRQALPDPAALRTAETYVAPRDAVEAVLAHIAATLLARDTISVLDNFFDLGGHSLLVIRLVSQIRTLLQIEIPPGVVFDHPRIADLAQAARRYEGEPGGLERLAQLRWKWLSLPPDERAALLERARHAAQTGSSRV